MTPLRSREKLYKKESEKLSLEIQGKWRGNSDTLPEYYVYTLYMYIELISVWHH